jgi:hypothetical protein
MQQHNDNARRQLRMQHLIREINWIIINSNVYVIAKSTIETFDKQYFDHSTFAWMGTKNELESMESTIEV